MPKTTERKQIQKNRGIYDERKHREQQKRYARNGELLGFNQRISTAQTHIAHEFGEVFGSLMLGNPSVGRVAAAKSEAECAEARLAMLRFEKAEAAKKAPNA